jgi:tetratricopeptide (TPR) repeat protein
MTRRRTQAGRDETGRDDAGRAGAPPAGARLIERGAFVVLLAMIPLRMFVSERTSLYEPSMSRYAGGVVGAQPGTTLVISVVVLIATVAVAAVRVRWGNKAYRWTGIEFGGAILAAGGLIALVTCGAPRSAVNGYIGICAILVYGVLLRQLIRAPWQRRALLCVIIATGACVAIKSIRFVVWELPETVRYYEAHLADSPDGAFAPSDPGRLYDYQQRMRSGAAMGYFSHSNVAATVLASIAAAAMGLTLIRWRASGGRASGGRVIVLAPACAALLCCVGLWLTMSKGGVAALLCGAGGYAVWWFGRRWFRARPRATWLVFWMLVLMGLGGVVTYGMTTGGLPSASMLYRWLYWRGGAAMIADQGVWGVGPEQFGVHFTRYKPVECPEEVRSPHSWVMRAASEWGIAGLAGMCLMWLRVSARLATAASDEDDARDAALEPDRVAAADEGRFLPVVVGVVATVGAAALAIHAGDLRSDGNVNYVFSLVGEYLLIWLAAVTVIAAESRDMSRWSNAGMPGLRAIAAAAAGVFLLHATVDLAMFEFGPATLFFALIALAASTTNGEMVRAPNPRPRLAMGIAIGGAMGVMILCVATVRPVLSASAAMASARLRAGEAGPARSWGEFVSRGMLADYQRAIAADPRDPVSVDELLDAAISHQQTGPLLRTPDWWSQAMVWAALLEQRDPAADDADRYRAAIQLIEYRLTGRVAQLDAAIASFRRTVDHYPTSPDRRKALADLLAERSDAGDPASLVEARNRAEARRLAIEEYEKTLELDALRVYVSKPNRLSAEAIAAIRERIDALRARPAPDS